MARKILALSLGLLCGFLSINRAEALDLYVLGSYWEIDDADGAWGAGVGASFPISSENLVFDTRVYFFENSDLGSGDDLELLPLDFGLQYHFSPEDNIDPYIVGGASYIFADADRVDVDSDFGAYVGGGLDFGVSDSVDLFGEALYRFAELDRSGFGSDDDLNVGGITGNFGVKFTFN